MSAVNLAQNPELLRRDAEAFRAQAAALPPSEVLRVRLNAVARELDSAADVIESLPADQRADLIEMLRSIAPN